VSRRAFGRIQQLPSGRHRARYTCPTCTTVGRQVLHAASGTYASKTDARAWLTAKEGEITRARLLGDPYKCEAVLAAERERAEAQHNTFRAYAEAWLARRSNPASAKPLTMRTAAEYERQLVELYETFGDLAVDGITRAMVRTWWEVTLPAKYPKGRPTANAHTYALLRTILNDAVDRELIEVNPCRIKGAGQSKRRKEIKPATVAQVYAIADSDKMPDRYRMAIHLAAWCSQRFGEVFELRRRDVAEDGSTITVQRGMTYKGKVWRVGAPKADSAGTVPVPPHLWQPLLDHIEQHAQPGPDGLLFWREKGYNQKAGSCDAGPDGGNCGHVACRGGHYYSQGFDKYWRPAKAAAGRSDLRFHDLRHTGNLWAAKSGASLADQMQRLRHSTVNAAMRYQHAADGRGAELAASMSELPELRLLLGGKADAGAQTASSAAEADDTATG